MDPHDEVLQQRVGQTIAGRWTLRSLIGSGGMAAVYAADNPAGQVVAIKLLYPEMGIRKEIRERFLREAAVMARIVHPGMVTIFEQGQSGELAYLAMELLHGETIAARVRRLGRLEPNEVLIILDQVLDVLNLAHSMAIVHRDLKPENLFLTLDGQIKVLDFGLARLLDAGADSFRTRTGAALGTLPYMAPEQALGRRDEVDARTDLFALGATAFRLLTGHRIHEAPSEAELLMRMASESAKPLVMVAPDLSPELGAVVDRALAFAKTSRYPDAATMQQDVRALLNGQPPAYALYSRERDESATKIDRQAPKVAGTVPLPNSTRPLHAALAGAAPLEPIVQGLPPTAFDPGAAPTEPNAPLALDPLAQIPASRHILPATVVMPTSQREAGTVPDQIAVAQPDTHVLGTAFSGASIPIAPMSDVALQRQRQRTLVVGLVLLFGMLGVATAAGWYVFGASSSASPEGSSGLVGAASATKVSQTTSSNSANEAVLRHPSHVMAPDSDPEPQREPQHESHQHSGSHAARATAATAPVGSATASAAAPASTTPSGQHQANLLPAAATAVSAAVTAAVTVPVVTAMGAAMAVPAAQTAPVVPVAPVPAVVPPMPPPGAAAKPAPAGGTVTASHATSGGPNSKQKAHGKRRR